MALIEQQPATETTTERTFLDGRFTMDDLQGFDYDYYDIGCMSQFDELHKDILQIFNEAQIDVELVQFEYDSARCLTFMCVIEDVTITWKFIPFLMDVDYWKNPGWMVTIDTEEDMLQNYDFSWDSCIHNVVNYDEKKLLAHKEKVLNNIRAIIDSKTITLK